MMKEVLALATLGFPAFERETYCQHFPRPDQQYFDSGKPMSKRRKRRLAAKQRTSHG